MNWKKYISVLVCVLFCSAPVLWLAYTGKLKVLLTLPWITVAAALLITVAAVLCSGLQYFLSLKHLGCKIEKKDIFFYPYMQSLAGLLIPAQGSSLFALFYLKMRYHFQMTQSVVMVLFLYLLNFIFCGLAGIIYFPVSTEKGRILFCGSILCLLVPFFVFLLCLVLKKRGRLPFFPKTKSQLLLTAMGSMNELLSNFPLLRKLLLLQFIRQCIMAGGYILICQQLYGRTDFLWGYLVVVSQDLSLILKFTPGNLGMAEAIAGLVSGITGISIAAGVACSLVMSLLFLLLTFVLGFWGIWMQMRGTSFPSLRDIVQKIKRSDT